MPSSLMYLSIFCILLPASLISDHVRAGVCHLQLCDCIIKFIGSQQLESRILDLLLQGQLQDFSSQMSVVLFEVTDEICLFFQYIIKETLVSARK